MILGLDGVEIGLIVVFFCLFAGIMTGYPVAFAIGGAAVIAFGLLALLDANGILLKQVIDTSSEAYRNLRASGVASSDITQFRYPDLPLEVVPLFESGWQGAFTRTLSFIVNRMNERVFAGPSIETLLAVAMFVLMGITLERSRIANDLLTTMARVFGPLPGGLAVSVVVVGALLAASTGIVGATVVTMGLLSLPTMLRNHYSPELSTGVIAASGTLGQIIPPSIVIVLLGTLAGDLYATAQEARAKDVGCSDALTYLGEAAVLSVGTLFKAAVLPGIMLAVLYAAYAFGYALLNPASAPAVHSEDEQSVIGRRRGILWFLIVPFVAIVAVFALHGTNLAGLQQVDGNALVEARAAPELRTRVSDQCRAAMISLHGQEKWDRSHALTTKIAASDTGDGAAVEEELTPEQRAEQLAAAALRVPPLSSFLLISLLLIALVFTTTYGISRNALMGPLVAGGTGIVLALFVDAVLVGPFTSPGATFLLQAVPMAFVAYGLYHALPVLGRVELLRVVFPPLVLIVAVLGSILGGITNPTPAAALGAAGAILLAAYRRLQESGHPGGRFILVASFCVVIFLLIGINFDLRTGITDVGIENWIAVVVALIAYHIAFGGLIYACWALWRHTVLTPVVRETAKVTSMVFAILIGSQMLNLVVISFGGEHYIQSFLRSFEQEWVAFLFVMLVLFILGFVLDFLEIIYIVIPIVGPVIYGGTMDPSWVTIMIAVNLQTSFLTPPFGFALFYLRGVAPPAITTGHIYRGVAPFVVIQVIGLLILTLFPGLATWIPELLFG